jgi:hypothetical protein
MSPNSEYQAIVYAIVQNNIILNADTTQMSDLYRHLTIIFQQLVLERMQDGHHLE